MPTRRGGIHLRLSSTAKDTSGKYAGAAYPQWMRILEDKYQKLHQKIALASRLNSVRSQGNTRTVRDGATSRRTSAKFSSNIDITDSDEYNRNNATVCAKNKVAGGATPAVEKNFAKSEMITVTVDSNFVKNGSKFQKELKGVSKCPKESNNSFMFQEELKASSKFQDELTDGSRFQKKPKDCSTFRILTTSLSEGNETTSSTTGTRMSRFNKKDNLERRVLSRYPPNRFNVDVNTAHSKESHYTSRSCPAIIQTLKQMGAPPRGALTGNYHRGPLALKSLNMFSKMSSEAQHAVSETLIEMGAERSNSITTDTSSAVDLSDVIKVSGTPKERPFTNINSRFLHTLAQRRKGLGTGTIRRERQCHHVASNASTHSSNSTEFSHRTRLPQLSKPNTLQLPASRVCCIENITATRLRIPPLCKYDVAVFRESTFQITLPDFDIRYRDVLTSERCDSETPPLEIREEAIKKCQEWLTKYTNR
ncbi:uncharacterized protein LOC121382165 [Gigantopelta aegis]|uniref:uncharacterized protein LOC121382165 n=1 Tax=Gigantopelta aegis TaxID=1735272 RepID=UPI001B88C2C5|nr:uncharacterized protein LOC121382165 [Gigantopelta aegis]